MLRFYLSGGALKPSTIQGLWVHVYCAWFIPEMSFQSVSKMEPADGLTDIDFNRFNQVGQWTTHSIFLFYSVVYVLA